MDTAKRIGLCTCGLVDTGQVRQSSALCTMQHYSEILELLKRLGLVLRIVAERGELAAGAQAKPVHDICCADHAPRYTALL